MSLRLLSLASGIGGLDRAVEAALDAEVVAFAEYDKYAAEVFARNWPGVPNLGDIKQVDWSQLENIDVICGGIPCQPWSTAGKLGRTLDDRHLWPAVADAIRILRPRFVIIEEVAGFLAAGGLNSVLVDLSALGFDAEWTTVRAAEVGAPHRRERLFLFAWHPERSCSDALASVGGPRDSACESSRNVAHADRHGRTGGDGTVRADDRIPTRSITTESR